MVVSFSCLLTDCTNVMDTRFQIVKVPTAWLGKDTVLTTSFMKRTAAYVAWNFVVLAEGAASPMAHKIQDPSIKGALVAHGFSNTLNGTVLVVRFHDTAVTRNGYNVVEDLMYVPVSGLTPISGFYGEPLAKGGNPIMPDDLLAGPATRDIRICARFGCWPALGWGLPPPQTTRLFCCGLPLSRPPPNCRPQTPLCKRLGGEDYYVLFVALSPGTAAAATLR